MSCQTTFGAAAGAFRDGPWIHTDGTWDPTAKLQAEGSVAWPDAEYAARVEGANRIIATNGVPGAATTGVFPIAPTDPAYQYDRNPNAISPRMTTFTVPAEPAIADADLDICHGRSSPISWNGQTVDMYHYVATLEYPYTIGCFRGTPARS
jgi:hypothetical protein